jgi:hypothetical protein
MSDKASVCVDLINRRPIDEAFVLVLVEDGPWLESEILGNLKRLQARLAKTVDAVIDGSFARQFPESLGKHFVIRLNAYGIVTEELDLFFTRFTDWIKTSDKVIRGIAERKNVRSLHFEYNKY